MQSNSTSKKTIREITLSNKDIPYTDMLSILCFLLKKRKEDILSNLSYKLGPKESFEFAKLLKRYRNREPLAYIVGYKWFYDSKFIINKNTLIPRIETEQIVTNSLEIISSHETEPLDILEIGTGSGCIAISITKEVCKNPPKYPSTKILATDIDQKTLEVAQKNADKILQPWIIKKTWSKSKIKYILESTKNKITHELILQKANILPNKCVRIFDLIISNPPYIPTGNIALLDNSVKDFEPHLALDGGKDGMEIFRQIEEITFKHIKPTTQYIFEGYQGKIFDKYPHK